MRCRVPTLLALAAAAAAASIGSEDWAGELTQPPGPWLLRAGYQRLFEGPDVRNNNANQYFIPGSGSRLHAELLVIAQTYPESPGLMVGVGVSHATWTFETEVEMVGNCIDGYLGMTFPFAVNEGRMRLEVLLVAGAGSGSVDQDISGRTAEFGLETSLVLPFRRSGFEVAVTGGLLSHRYISDQSAPVISGITYPEDLTITGTSWVAGLSLGYRY